MKVFLFIWTLHYYVIFILDFIYDRDLYTIGWGLFTITSSLLLIRKIRMGDRIITNKN